MATLRKLRPEPLWVRVDRNRVKVTAFVVAYVGGSAVLLTLALVALPGFLLGPLAEITGWVEPATWYSRLPWVVLVSLVVMLAIGGLMSAVQLANAEDWVRNRLSAAPASETLPVAGAVADISLAAGLARPPRLLVLAGSGVNAFALGTTRGDPVIGVTKGLLAELTLDEQRAVIATLVARIVSGDIMFGTALAALMGPLKAVRELRAADGLGRGCGDGCGDGCDLSGCDGCGGGGAGCALVVLYMMLVAFLTYLAVVAAAWIVTIWGRLLQRTSYEKADAEGMLLLRDPSPMLSALSKVSRSSTGVAGTDPSYDGIFYAPTSGRPTIEAVERRRFDRLCEVVGTDGLAATL